MKDRQVTLFHEQSKQRFNVLYAAVVPVMNSRQARHSRRRRFITKQDFRVGQRVSFTDQSLKRHVGEIVRINQRTANVHCDG
ncbi:hypothetical protein [Variovorax sp. V15]|uniref:hypothetical protein n=1 Tax=Variovorax sp. V15 TaxID=3065952 RepID=UPI0034E8C898